jgi:hypothetical protein
MTGKTGENYLSSSGGALNSSRSQTARATPKQISKPTGTTIKPQKLKLVSSIFAGKQCGPGKKKANIIVAVA